MMDRQGVAAAVLTTALWAGLFNDARDASAARRFARSLNEVAAEAIRGHPSCLGGFASVPLLDVDDALAEIDYGFGTLGLDGVVLLTNANGIYLGDSRLDPVFDELSRRRGTLPKRPGVSRVTACLISEGGRIASRAERRPG
jgi:6-methylsalicylate decarboxylase